MSNKTNPTERQGEKSSLWNLTSENAIVIPIIQRDYAQGRTNDDVRQIREPFLKKIFKVLNSENEKLELDFVYGTLEKPKDISSTKANYENFVPLDGQQRLTTLFLLHWFLSVWNDSDFRLMQEQFNGRFSYATRLSSSDFCNELLEHVCAQDVRDSFDRKKKNAISSMLQNEGWFHNQWKNDPTICGMLTMLDTMLLLFNEMVKDQDKAPKANTYFKRLICEDVEDTAITFNILYINKGEFHLSDELYIKMNSRGKPLSDFETFKARFESFIAKNTQVNSDFSGNIDGKWADVFWTLRNTVKPRSEEDNKTYYRDNTDGMMMNVIKIALSNRFAILTENNDSGLDELFESQVAMKANPNMHLTFYRYTELGVFNEPDDDSSEEEDLEPQKKRINESVCQSVYDTLSFVCDIKGQHADKYKIDPDILKVDELLNNILFYGIDGKNSKITGATYSTRLMFWALSEFCIKYQDAIHNCNSGTYWPLIRWIRFARNMIESAEINSAADMQKALKFLDSIFPKETNDDIIKHLSAMTNAPEDCSPFPQSQIKEEILKSRLIEHEPSWENYITEADNVKAWSGRSGYLLYFAELSDKLEQDIQAWDAVTHATYQVRFSEYKHKMDMLLSYLEGNKYQEKCLLERALLSKGCYFRKEDDRSDIYSMMDQSISSRSYSFRQMVQYNGINCDNDKSVYREGVDCLKEVLDDSNYKYANTNDVAESLKNIINEHLSKIKDWRWPLIVNPEIWHEAWQRFVWIHEDNDGNRTAWVVRQKSGGTNQYETWSYHLYSNLGGLNYNYYPHSYPRYTFLNFNVESQRYQLRIKHTFEGKWKFQMVAIDENYQTVSLTQEMRSFIFNLMPNYSSTFFKDDIHDAILWADAMQKCIMSNYELLQ